MRTLTCTKCTKTFEALDEDNPMKAALGGTEQKDTPQERLGRDELGWQDNRTQESTCKILRGAGIRWCFYYTDACSEWNTRLTT